MLNGKLFEASVILLSMLVVATFYLLIVRRDGSWINWSTPVFLFSIGTKYVFQFIYLCLNDPGGSRYAYVFCYLTYALSFLIGAMVYAFVNPIKIRVSRPYSNMAVLSWLLLILGFLLYLPVLVEFHAYIGSPRRIYELTRTGYGLYFFGSTTLNNLGFVTFLFTKKKGFAQALLFYALSLALAYLHGSKGQIITYLLIWMLHRVYAAHEPIRAVAASAMLCAATVLLIGSFALFADNADLSVLAVSVTGYADTVRNAMKVIDDQNETRYYGRLLLETEVYSRIPRLLMPDKPKDFGAFILAKTYDPAGYRRDEGASAFDIGVMYADFGPWSLILICAYSALSAAFVSGLVQHLGRGAGPGTFIVFLFLVGVSVIPLSGPFYLPESMMLGGAITLASRFHPFRFSSEPAPTTELGREGEH